MKTRFPDGDSERLSPPRIYAPPKALSWILQLESVIEELKLNAGFLLASSGGGFFAKVPESTDSATVPKFENSHESILIFFERLTNTPMPRDGPKRTFFIFKPSAFFMAIIGPESIENCSVPDGGESRAT